MKLLCLDVGSSSVKGGIVSSGRVIGPVVRAEFPTTYDGPRVEVDARDVMGAIAQVIAALGHRVKKVDGLAHAAMSPSWIAMDKSGRAITPIITHQDRRSAEQSDWIGRHIGLKKHLKITGNLPYPGGISSTTARWIKQHQPGVMKRAELIGHFSTYFIRQLAGGRVTDPSNASFMGLYNTLKLSGWNADLCRAAGVRLDQLPEVIEAHEVAGRVKRHAAMELGLTEGLPVCAGCMDTSAAMLLAGAKVGQLVNVCGSTDVLAVCTDKPAADEKLLTRALGIGRRWMQVCTIAASGSALKWVKDQLFSEMSEPAYRRLLGELAKQPAREAGVLFRPYLAGDRMSLEQKQGAFEGLTLGTTRRGMLSAVIDALAQVSTQRIGLIAGTGVKLLREVMISGGVAGGLDRVMHRDWPGRWRFVAENEATLRGLSLLPME